MSVSSPASLSLLRPPYRFLVPVTRGRPQLKEQGRGPGSALVWDLARGMFPQDLSPVKNRPGGLALIVLLPAAEHGRLSPDLLHVLELCRPLGVLPQHDAASPQELAQVLRRPPEDLASELTEYVRWRGIRIDRETAHLVRRTVELSTELRSISALSRALYLSRRALGRRFLAQGLPVPSHWLHFARILRVAIRLQNSSESVLTVAYQLGYPDGFSLSNQMMRLTGFRPTDAREGLGWEWLVEAWLRKEADTGGLAPEITVEVLQGARDTLEARRSRGGRARPRRDEASTGGRERRVG